MGESFVHPLMRKLKFDKYCNLFVEPYCTCKPVNRYFLRSKKARVYCYVHDYFNRKFHDIQTEGEFGCNVNRLDTFNKLNKFLRESKHFQTFEMTRGEWASNINLRLTREDAENQFYLNARELCNVCQFKHPSISKNKTKRLMRFLYVKLSQAKYEKRRYPGYPCLYAVDDGTDYADHESSDYEDEDDEVPVFGGCRSIEKNQLVEKTPDVGVDSIENQITERKEDIDEKKIIRGLNTPCPKIYHQMCSFV